MHSLHLRPELRASSVDWIYSSIMTTPREDWLTECQKAPRPNYSENFAGRGFDRGDASSPTSELTISDDARLLFQGT
jgi:hypothetical protein